MSLAYVVLRGILGGSFAALAVGFLTAGAGARDSPTTDYRQYLPSGIAVASVIALLQVCRVLWSKRRQAEDSGEACVASFRSPHRNLQGLVLFAMLIPLGLAWLIGGWLHSGGR